MWRHWRDIHGKEWVKHLRQPMRNYFGILKWIWVFQGPLSSPATCSRTNCFVPMWAIAGLFLAGPKVTSGRQLPYRLITSQRSKNKPSVSGRWKVVCKPSRMNTVILLVHCECGCKMTMCQVWPWRVVSAISWVHPWGSVRSHKLNVLSFLLRVYPYWRGPYDHHWFWWGLRIPLKLVDNSCISALLLGEADTASLRPSAKHGSEILE